MNHIKLPPAHLRIFKHLKCLKNPLSLLVRKMRKMCEKLKQVELEPVYNLTLDRYMISKI